jgi:hypothetical protein
MMNNPWVLYGAGILFCCLGIYLFFRNVFEEDRSVVWPVFVMIMGVLLIVAGTAQYLKSGN